jgi:integrase
MANSTKITLKIIPFTYPTGNQVWRVTGRILGRIVQKNFPTYDQAEVFMSGAIKAATQGKNGPRTRLVQTIFQNDQDLHAAELAFSKLKVALPNGSITTAVDYYLEHCTAVVADTPAKEAVEKFTAHKRALGGQAITASVTGSVLKLFIREQGIARTSEITAERAKVFVFDEALAVRTRRDRHDLLHNFFEYLIAEHHMAKNLMDGIERPKVTNDGEVSVFTVEQCQKILDVAATEPGGRHRARGAMLPYIASCLLSGLRPDEAKRMKPDWSNFSFANGVIVGFRAKVKRTRHVGMHDQLPGILEQCKQAGFAPGYFSRKTFEAIQRKAGVRKIVDGTEQSSWDNDILRHCYASHHYALHADKGFLIKNMGNSEDVLDQSYLNLTVLAADGAKFFAMQPTNTVGLGTNVPRTQSNRNKPAAVAHALPAAPAAIASPNEPSQQMSRGKGGPDTVGETDVSGGRI